MHYQPPSVEAITALIIAITGLITAFTALYHALCAREQAGTNKAAIEKVKDENGLH